MISDLHSLSPLEQTHLECAFYKHGFCFSRLRECKVYRVQLSPVGIINKRFMIDPLKIGIEIKIILIRILVGYILRENRFSW